MKLQLPYAFDTESSDGKKGRLSFPATVIWESQFDSSLNNEQIKSHLTNVLNKYGNKVRDMQIVRTDDMIKAICYSDYSKYRPGEKWIITLEDVTNQPINKWPYNL